MITDRQQVIALLRRARARLTDAIDAGVWDDETQELTDLCVELGEAVRRKKAERLLPVPIEVRTEYRAWLHGGDSRGIRLETESSPRRADVVAWGDDQIGRYGITGYRVMRREHHNFPQGARYATAITDWVEDAEEQR